ncbi:MAG: hypothetical protein Q9182_003368 [Xanthomendoza sp. 2 TL-2023]
MPSLNYLVSEVDVGEVIRVLDEQREVIRLAHSLIKDVSGSSVPTTDYLLALSRQYHIAEGLGRFLATFHLMEIYFCKSPAVLAQSQHAPKVEIMTDNLVPHLLIISHMLGKYRNTMATIVQHADHDHPNVEKLKSQSRHAEHDILKEYSLRLIEKTLMVFEMLKKTLFRQLRPASYATLLERRIRGWTEPSAQDDQVMSLIVFGGLDAIKEIISISSYNMRIRALENWLATAGIPQMSQPKKNRAMPKDRSMDNALSLATIKRIQTILPDRSEFFNVLAIAAPGNSEFHPSHTAGLDPQTFMLWLRSEQPKQAFKLWK